MRLTSLALVLSWVAAPAFALTFSSSCDRFEIDGNNFGPFDGSVDFADDFDNASLAPDWSVLLGTVEEAGTDITAHDPGVSVQLGSTLFEISTIENEVDVGNGEGSFTMTSYWEPTPPGTDAEFHMQLYSLSPIIEAAGLSMNNFSSQVAMQQGSGALTGYSISQTLTDGVGSGFTTVQSNSVPIDPMLITGRIVFRMALDDTTDLVTSSFSLDGGTTFLSPFPPIHIFNSGVADYEILLGAAGLSPNNTPPPPDQLLPLKLLLVKNPDGPESRRVTYKASSKIDNFFGNPTTGGATLNLKLDSVTQCFHMPPSGWSRNGRAYAYADPAGLYGPIKVAQWRQSGNGSIVNKVVILGKNGPVDIVPPNPGTQGDATFHVGGGADYCASTAGGTIRPNDAKRFKARNAPAPAACYVPACSPSGAFLDDPADGVF
jgi:hypothetical protein